MLERETDTILAELTARTIGTRTEARLREVLEADIPRGVKAYMQEETVRWLARDLASSPNFARIDRETVGVDRLSRSFLRTMAEGYVYHRGEFLTLLENAVLFLENYLCRPQWTIENYVFESGDRLPLGTISDKLTCAVEFGYFKTLIEKIARMRGWSEIGREDFRSLLIAIDDQVVKQHDARELALLAKPIFDFILLRDSPPDAEIPLKPLLVFFDDKKMKILRDYIESICRIRERERITLDELTALVEDLYLGQGESKPATEITDEPAEMEGRRGEGIPMERLDDAPPPAPAIFDYLAGDPNGLMEDTAEEPATKDRRGREGAPSDRPEGKGVPPERPTSGSPGRRSPALSLTFAGLEGSPPTELADLNHTIQGHQRSRFVKRLFGRDEERYNEAIASLNGARTWKDAATMLHRLYTEAGLDPFDADVVAFTDAVHQRYRNPETDAE
ncbi:MAG: hypothetical protein AB1428_07365 [Bacteroidota bacterium]